MLAPMRDGEHRYKVDDKTYRDQPQPDDASGDSVGEAEEMSLHGAPARRRFDGCRDGAPGRPGGRLSMRI